MTLAVGCLAVLLAASLLIIDRLLKQMQEERQATRLERTGLLQRIQAPSMAVVEHAIGTDPELPAAPETTDDQAYWEAVNR